VMLFGSDAWQPIAAPPSGSLPSHLGPPVALDENAQSIDCSGWSRSGVRTGSTKRAAGASRPKRLT